MKRILAFVVDFNVMQIIASAVVKVFSILESRLNQRNKLIGIEIFFLIVGVIVWLYFFISDYFFSGGSIGKKLLGIKLVCERQGLLLPIALKHSVAKTIACCVCPVTAVYYLFTRRLPYDRWLKLEIIDR